MINPSETQLSLLPAIAHPKKERPLLMTSSMVRATLNDSKSQTRRLQDLDRINQSPDDWEFLGVSVAPRKNKDLVSTARFRHKSGEEVAIGCRYGKPGNLLWIRETWGEIYSGGYTLIGCSDCVAYRADGTELQSGQKWKPSIFMPRWACRIVLEITDIRVERLQEISESDAIGEGVERSGDGWKCYGNCPAHSEGYDKRSSATASYMSLWDSINDATCPWISNPFVWVVEFKKA